MSSDKARTCRRGQKQREIRVAKRGSARDAIGELFHGIECYILTFGQFSLIDVLVVILDQIGLADVTIATWTAADAHLEEAAQLVERAQVRSMRWIVDRSFLARQPEYCAHMRRLFGDDCIRSIKSHAKFMLIVNDAWNICVRTSMNLNGNPRLENVEISDDATLAAFLARVSDEIFREREPGAAQRGLPRLEGICDDRECGVTMGKVGSVGYARVM